jgi:cell division septal protein FtsQ
VVLGVPVALGAALRVLAALAAVLGVLAALGAVLRVLAASAVRAVRVEGARSVPRFLSRPEDRRTARIPGV